MAKNPVDPLVTQDDSGLRYMPPEEAVTVSGKHSRLIAALKRAERCEETVLDLSHNTFGKLVDDTQPLILSVHNEINYIRNFLFYKNWEHLRYINFADQNLSQDETNIIMMSIIHPQGEMTLGEEESGGKILSGINLRGNQVSSENLDFFSMAIADPKKPEEKIWGMLHLKNLNLTNCGIDPDDENVHHLKDLGINVIIADEELAFATSLGKNSCLCDGSP